MCDGSYHVRVLIRPVLSCFNLLHLQGTEGLHPTNNSVGQILPSSHLFLFFLRRLCVGCIDRASMAIGGISRCVRLRTYGSRDCMMGLD